MMRLSGNELEEEKEEALSSPQNIPKRGRPLAAAAGSALVSEAEPQFPVKPSSLTAHPRLQERSRKDDFVRLFFIF